MSHKVLKSLLVLGLVAWFAPTASAQDKTDKSKEGHGHYQEQGQSGDEGMAGMADMMKMTAPGAEHKNLEQLAGKWTVASKFWMMPDAPPVESTGSSEITWVLGGRYLRENYHGTMMGNMPFEGIGYYGFDKLKEKYNSSWIDNMGTGIYTSEGTCDPSGKVFTYFGTMDDAMTGEQNRPYKMINRIINADKHVGEMWNWGPDGKDYKVMELTYTRAK